MSEARVRALEIQLGRLVELTNRYRAQTDAVIRTLQENTLTLSARVESLSEAVEVLIDVKARADSVAQPTEH
jgi:hypothetical protein